MTRLVQVAPWLELSAEQRRACADSDDCLDALVCALVARASERGLTPRHPTGSSTRHDPRAGSICPTPQHCRTSHRPTGPISSAHGARAGDCCSYPKERQPGRCPGRCRLNAPECRALVQLPGVNVSSIVKTTRVS
jgi:hypothetical protein